MVQSKQIKVLAAGELSPSSSGEPPMPLGDRGSADYADLRFGGPATLPAEVHYANVMNELDDDLRSS
jgi:hypothetical protein